MKKYFSYLLALVALASCSQSENPEIPNSPNNPESETAYSNVRTAADAIHIAEYAVSGEATQSRSARSVGSVRAIVDHASRGESDTLFYAVDYEDGQGFALVSAPKHLDPLLALVDEGSYNDAVNSQNEEIQFALGQIKEYTQTSSGIPDTIEVIIPPAPDTIYARPKSTPVVNVKWGQIWPEGKECPYKLAGSGAVAVAQILSAMKRPTAIQYTYSNSNTYTPLNWDVINQHVLSLDKNDEMSILMHQDECSLVGDKHSDISKLVREIGHRSSAQYKTNETVITFDNALKALKSLSQKSPVYTGTQNEDLYNNFVKSNNRVALLCGVDNSKSVEKCYFWIADGYWEMGKIIRVYHVVQEWDPNRPNTDLITYTDRGSITKYLRLNWGASGNCNGYFLYDAIFNPQDGVNYGSNPHTLDPAHYDTSFRYAIFDIN